LLLESTLAEENLVRASIRGQFAAALLLAAFAAAARAESQAAFKESDEYFKSATIVELDLEIGKKELDSLRGEPRKYVKITFKEGGKVVGKDVGIHLKGAAGSFRGIDDKPGLTINMDKFVAGQTFHGMDKFHLANSVQDPSYLSELICGELFRAAGVPASRIQHVVLSINGKRRGFYYLKEGYDKFFLTRHFGNNAGNFYDGGFLRDIDQPLQLIHTKDDVKEQAELKALVAATRIAKPEERFAKMEKLLDLDKFLAYTALESITWDWDGYPMNRNNYRIYHDPKHDKIVFIPSGMDQMFGEPRGPVLPNFQGLVAHTLIETLQGKERYLAKVEEIMKKVYNADALVKRLDELEKRVQPALASVDAGAGRDYKSQVNRLREAIKIRAKDVEEQMKKLKKK
jgi:spore coat protein CotH